MRKSLWPAPYFADVRVWDPKLNRAKIVQLPILLPHEVLHQLGVEGNKTILYSKEGLDPAALAHLQAEQQIYSHPMPLTHKHLD